jgi:acetate kinase
MGFSPLEGVVMATRSGSIDATALLVLKEELGLDQHQLETYLNTKGGLLGLSCKSDDVRELLELEAQGDHKANLALETYLYNIRKAIGQMSAVLNGIDGLVFTGTVGERSAIMRGRLIEKLSYLDLYLDKRVNDQLTSPTSTTLINIHGKSKPIFVVPTDEAAAIAHHAITYGL